MRKIFSIISIIGLTSSLYSGSLICEDTYTTITAKKSNIYKADGSKGKGNTKITIEFGDKAIYLSSSGSDKVELIYLGKGVGNMYMLEKTSAGNFNMYSLFDDGTLSISKSYDILGMTKLHLQALYQCKDK